MDTVVVVAVEETTPKKCMTVRKSVKKDGTVVTKEYDQSKYNKKCYEKNKERYCEMTTCGCGREYNIYTKSNHQKSAFHKLYEKMCPPITAVAPISISNESFNQARQEELNNIITPIINPTGRTGYA